MLLFSALPCCVLPFAFCVGLWRGTVRKTPNNGNKKQERWPSPPFVLVRCFFVTHARGAARFDCRRALVLPPRMVPLEKPWCKRRNKPHAPASCVSIPSLIRKPTKRNKTKRNETKRKSVLVPMASRQDTVLPRAPVSKKSKTNETMPCRAIASLLRPGNHLPDREITTTTKCKTHAHAHAHKTTSSHRIIFK